jgi:hypothetical protein
MTLGKRKTRNILTLVLLLLAEGELAILMLTTHSNGPAAAALLVHLLCLAGAASVACLLVKMHVQAAVHDRLQYQLTFPVDG